MWRIIPWGKQFQEWLRRRAAERALREAEWAEEVERDEAFQRLVKFERESRQAYERDSRQA